MGTGHARSLASIYICTLANFDSSAHSRRLTYLALGGCAAAAAAAAAANRHLFLLVEPVSATRPPFLPRIRRTSPFPSLAAARFKDHFYTLDALRIQQSGRGVSAWEEHTVCSFLV